MNLSLILLSTAVAVSSAFVVPVGQRDGGASALPGSAVGCGTPTPWVVLPDLEALSAPPGGGPTFIVTNSGSSAYLFSGQPGSNPTLTLTRGVTYTFSNTVSAAHPLQIRLSSGGANFGAGSGVTGAGTATMTFTPDFFVPAALVYQCGVHSAMLGNIFLVSPPVLVAPKAFLEGPYDPATGLMADALRTLPGFPATEPYTALGYAHVGGGGATVDPAALMVPGNNAIVDWVVAELRDATTPTVVVATRSALLQRDGDVVGTDGNLPLQFNVAPGNYKLALRHRNHLGVMTLNAVALSSVTTFVDFTSAATATFGTNARKSITGTFPAQVLWAGDVSFNGADQYTGSGNDRDPILVTVGSTTPNNVLSNAYSTRDVNMNGEVKYTGSLNDRDPILVNVGSTTPNNVRVQQLP